MRQSTVVLVAAVTLVSVALIAERVSAAGGIQLPRLFDPPTSRQQVAEAQIWDPYPNPYEGPYADGTRPRDFLYPPPKATVGRQPAPGTFPRPMPEVRSSAPPNYPNVKWWWIRKRQEAAAKKAAAAAAAAEAAAHEQQQAEEGPELVQPPQRPAQEF